MVTSSKELAEAAEPVYLEMIVAHADPRFGKMPVGTIKPIEPAKAARWLAANVAKLSSRAAYEKAVEKKEMRGDTRAQAIEDANARESGMWDATYRDAVLADPENLKDAMDRGIVITNLSALVDDEGIPLDHTASFDDVMNARDNFAHPDMAPDGHTSASTSGSRSHYQEPVPEKQRTPEMIATDQPKKRVGRIARHQIANTPEPDSAAEERARGNTSGDTLGRVESAV